MKVQWDLLVLTLIKLTYGAVCGSLLLPHFGWFGFFAAMAFPFAVTLALGHIGDWRIEIFVVFFLICVAVPAYRSYSIRTVLDQEVIAPMHAVLSTAEIRTGATGKRPATFEELGVARPAIPGLQRLSFDAVTGSVSVVVDPSAGRLGKLFPPVTSDEPLRFVFTPVRDQAGGQSWFCSTTDLPSSALPMSCYKTGIRLEHERRAAHYEKRDNNRSIADDTKVIGAVSANATVYSARGDVWYEKGDYDKAIADYTEAIHLEPSNAKTRYSRGGAWYKKRDHQRAIDDFTEVIRMDPQHIGAHGGAAWLLATAPVAELRDGKRAVELARKACELTQWKNPYAIQTLAIAHAESGNFAEAIRMQEKALAFPEFAKNAGEEARSRLALFRQNKPYRESPSAAPRQ